MEDQRHTTRPEGATSARRRPEERALEGWRSRLAALVTAGLGVELLTGLWIYAAPFSLSAQVQLVLHTVAGILLVVPYAVYQAHHLRTWAGQKLSVESVLGYALMAVVVVCIASGAVVTWQGALGNKLSGFWDVLHLVTGIATGVLIAAHVGSALLRRRATAQRTPQLSAAVRSFSLRSVGAIAAAALLVLALTVASPSRDPEFPPPEDYALATYAQEFEEYRGSIFAPTYARTAHATLVEPDALANSASCGTAGCHEEILAEWEPSAHRFSAMNPPFQQVQRNFAAEREPAETRYCAGCHDPISLFAGAGDASTMDFEAPGVQEGVSCVVCHSISEVDQRGNADYVLTPPKKYLWENQAGWRKFVSDFLIRTYPRQHLADYDRNILRSPEFCGSCHKQFIPEALNRFGVSPGQNQYDEWRQSHWHTDDAATDLSCQDCHMRLVHGSSDPGRGEAGDARRSERDGAHRHHGTIATNALMPEVLKLPHWEEQVRLTKEWMAGETVIPEIEHLWPEGPVVSVAILAPEEARTGEEITLRTVVANRKVGHNYTTGPLDFVRAWIHLRIEDSDGTPLAEWGAIDPETRRILDGPGEVHELGNSRAHGTMVLEAQPLDEHGAPLLEHELWKKAGGKGQRVIFPSYTDQQTYSFVVPEGTAGPLTVRADLNFRRYRQDFLERVVPDMERDSGVVQPTLLQSSAREVILVRAGTPGDRSGTSGSR